MAAVRHIGFGVTSSYFIRYSGLRS